MRQSVLFTKTRKEAPKDEVSRNAALLIRAGFLHKEMAGVYSYLPLGLRVLRKIEKIIRDEMNAIGGQEVLLTTLQEPSIWKKSGRWDDDAVDIWFKTQLKSGTEIGIANTHEEALTNMLRDHISSHRDLPKYIYQFQNKFRNELRAKSGIMRTREFIMKDLYSFNKTEEGFKTFYEQCADAYMRIFGRVGLGDTTYRTYASGGSFSKFSDEFQTLSVAGEDTIFVDHEKRVAVNKEVMHDDVLESLGLIKQTLKEEKAIEVGNIFPLGTKFSDALGLEYKDESGATHPVYMGSYGIGLGRVLGTIAEVHADDKGLVWPASVAPFQVHLIVLGKEIETIAEAEGLFNELQDDDISVLFDDRDISAGEKFADSDLIGIPLRLVVSKKTNDAKSVEMKKRRDDTVELIPRTAVLETIKKATLS